MAGTSTDSVSAEAHQRMVTERDQLKQQVEGLSSQLAAATRATQSALARAKYLEHRAKDDPALQAVAAELDIATPMLDGVDADKLDEMVGSVAEKLAAFRGPTSMTPPPTPAGNGNEPPPNTETPGTPPPTPNPGAEGGGAKPKLLDGAGISALVAEKGLAGARAAIDSGEIQLDQEVRERHGL
jgi:hypothetical protein